MTRDGRRQVGTGRIGVGSVTVVTAPLSQLPLTTLSRLLVTKKIQFSEKYYVQCVICSLYNTQGVLHSCHDRFLPGRSLVQRGA